MTNKEPINIDTMKVLDELKAWLNAERRMGIQDLLERILLEAEMLELKANPKLPTAVKFKNWVTSESRRLQRQESCQPRRTLHQAHLYR